MDIHPGETVRLCVAHKLSQNTLLEKGSSPCKERKTTRKTEQGLMECCWGQEWQQAILVRIAGTLSCRADNCSCFRLLCHEQKDWTAVLCCWRNPCDNMLWRDGRWQDAKEAVKLRSQDAFFDLKNVQGKISPVYHGKFLFLMLW